MNGVPEQPALHSRSTHGAVVPAPAPAGAAPGPDDGARAGDDSAPVPIPRALTAPAPTCPGTGAHGSGPVVGVDGARPALRPRPGPGPAGPVRVSVDGQVHDLAAGQIRPFPTEAPDA